MLRFRNGIIAALMIAACSPKPFKEAEKKQEVIKEEVMTKIQEDQAPTLVDSLGNVVPARFVPTVNFGERKPFYVMIHHTAQDSVQQTIQTFILDRTQVGAHYIIGRDGHLVQMLNDGLRAWHAGAGKWGNITDMNSCSIGIELDNNGSEPFAEEQIKTLLLLLQKLKTEYKIPAANFIAHSDYAPGRKTDPSTKFPWERLAKKGFGIWYDLPDAIPSQNFDVEAALRRIGYDTGNLQAAMVPFKRHFIQSDVSPTLTDWDKCVLHNVSRKF